MRTYEEISLGDLIDESFGPIEYEVDRALHHIDAKAVLAKASVQSVNTYEQVNTVRHEGEE